MRRLARDDAQRRFDRPRTVHVRRTDGEHETVEAIGYLLTDDRLVVDPAGGSRLPLPDYRNWDRAALSAAWVGPEDAPLETILSEPTDASPTTG